MFYSSIAPFYLSQNSKEDKHRFQIQYNDHTVHMWSVVPSAGLVDRQVESKLIFVVFPSVFLFNSHFLLAIFS